MRHFHTYLAGNTLEVVTDYVSLTFLQRMKISKNNRLARWAIFLRKHKFKKTYKKGVTLISAVATSRLENLSKSTEEWDAEEAMVRAVTEFAGKVHIEFGPRDVAKRVDCITMDGRSVEPASTYPRLNS
jgi:hypothetical protein